MPPRKQAAASARKPKPKATDSTYTTGAEEATMVIRTQHLPLLAGDPDSLILVLCDLEDTIKVWQMLRDDVKGLVLANLPPLRYKQAYTVEGVASVEPVPGQTKRKYDNPLVASAIAEALPPAFDAEGTDVRPDLVSLMVDITGAGTESFSSWRVNPLKALGIDVKRYVTEETRGKPSLILRRGDKMKSEETTTKETK